MAHTTHSGPLIQSVVGEPALVPASSDDPKATFRRPVRRRRRSKDRSVHSGSMPSTSATESYLERVAHRASRWRNAIKATTPTKPGRWSIVVAWFGSQGVHAYDLNGKFV